MFRLSSSSDPLTYAVGMKRQINSYIGAFVGTLLAAAWVLCPSARAEAQELRYAREYPLMRYAERDRADPIAELQRKIASGQARLAFDSSHGYLASLLETLGVPASSQMLVFSGTSVQPSLISAATPRAIYFADDVYVAWMQGSDVLEIAAMDPNLGPVFYTLDQKESDTPKFASHTAACLRCHDTYGLTGGGVPRFLIGSGSTDEMGRLAGHESWELTTDQTPLSHRWGGWYVTGSHGDQQHMGNRVVRTNDPAPAPVGNLTDLSGLLDTSPYLTGLSDIAALMVVEHQLHMQNLLTRLSWESRKVLAGKAEPAKIAALAEPVVEAMLFVDEAKLSGPISGTSGFREDFESRGPFDAEGRSLRQLDLTHRLFKYPLSFLIYSEAFNALPTEAKEQVFQRVWKVLAGVDNSKKFDHLSANDRAATLKILEDTHQGFARWLAHRGEDAEQ